MTAAYSSGMSLAQVAKAFATTRQNVYKMLSRRGVALRTPPARQSALFNGEKFTLRNNGYLGRTTGDRAMMHRVVWEHHNGPIPDGHDIHHIDGDRTNNVLSNLAMLPKADHTRHHQR